MSGTTPYLGLTSYQTVTDASSVLIYDYVDQTSGSSSTQNLGIIDTHASNTSASLILISASMVNVLTKLANTKSAEIQIVAPETDVDTVSGIFYFRVPSEFDGLNLSRAQAFTNTAGSPISVQVRNMTKYSGSDCLSDAIAIASGDVIGTPGTIDTDYDDVSTDDQIKIYVTADPETKPKGLLAVIEYVYP
jgi:hypothetical protein